MSDAIRNILAGFGASAAFLGLFFGLQIVLWAAAPLALLVFVGLLLALPRAPRPSVDQAAEAEMLTVALAALEEAATRLAAVADAAPSADRPVFTRLADLVARLREHHLRDPEDVRRTRTFLRRDLPRLVATAEAYVDLSARAPESERDRLRGLMEEIRTFAPALERIEKACVENDFLALEVETSVLGEQLRRG